MKISQSQIIKFLVLCLSLISFRAEGTNVEVGYNDYVIWPQKNEGGTFYLSQTKDEVSNKFKRKGYIQALTPIFIDSQSTDQHNRRFLKEHDRADRYPYYKFISATGSFGYVKDNSVKRLSELAERNGRSLIEGTYDNVLVPINPQQEVTLYQIKDGNELYKKASFSRSAKMFVVSNLNVKQILMPDGGYKDLISVKYWMKLAPVDGEPDKYKQVSAWVKSSNRDSHFQILPVTVPNTSAVRNENATPIDKALKMVGDWFSEYDTNQFERAMSKTCDSEVSLKATVKAELSGNFPIGFVRLEGAGEIEASYLFPRNYRYEVASYKDHMFGDTFRLLKTIHCKENTSSDWYLRQLVLDGEVINNVPQQLFHTSLLEQVKEYFRVPDLNGPIRDREKMIELRKFDSADDDRRKDYYTAFYKLNKYIDSMLSEGNIPSTKRLRISQLLIEEIVEF